ncbi:MAG: radical SAM protein [Spirochaetes bacterium]|nr:radical SAM protein [Spirochaetota bacterium]
MFLSNFFTFFVMIFDMRVHRFFKHVNALYKADPSYSRKKIVRYFLNYIKNEKITRHDRDYIFTSFAPPMLSRAFMSNLLAVRDKEQHIFTQQAQARRSAPISFFLSITDKCNFNCTHCSAKNRQNGNELTTEEWKQVIYDIQNMGTSIIGLTGGEPLMHKNIVEIVQSISDKSTSILYTNGSLLTPKMAADLKNSGLWAVGISLDSFDEAEHNAVRNNDSSFKHAIQAVKNAASANLYPMCQLVGYRDRINKKFFLNYMKFAKKIGAKEVRVLEPIKSGALSKKDASFFLTTNERIDLIAIQRWINSKFGLPKMTTFANTESFDQFGCGAGTQHSYIMSHGELLPCDFVPLSFGNVRKKPVKELWTAMTDCIGNPKNGCFAFTIQNDMIKHGSRSLPLPEKISRQICTDHRSEKLPKMYTVLV